jgi:non-ribosomal peptide synthetase component F
MASHLAGIATALVLSSADVQATDSAHALLAQATASVERAREQQALWLEAVRALVAAKAALARGEQEDSARLSRRAIELTELGLLQRNGGTGPAEGSVGPVRRER